MSFFVVARRLGVSRPGVDHFLVVSTDRQGLGVVYKATGAAYGGIQNELLAAEEAAKRARRGIWSQDKPVLPGEHKAKMREAKDKGKGKKETLEDDEVPRSLFSRVWGAVFGRR